MKTTFLWSRFVFQEECRLVFLFVIQKHTAHWYMSFLTSGISIPACYSAFLLMADDGHLVGMQRLGWKSGIRNIPPTFVKSELVYPLNWMWDLECFDGLHHQLRLSVHIDIFPQRCTCSHVCLHSVLYRVLRKVPIRNTHNFLGQSPILRIWKAYWSLYSWDSTSLTKFLNEAILGKLHTKVCFQCFGTLLGVIPP